MGKAVTARVRVAAAPHTAGATKSLGLLEKQAGLASEESFPLKPLSFEEIDALV